MIQIGASFDNVELQRVLKAAGNVGQSVYVHISNPAEGIRMLARGYIGLVRSNLVFQRYASKYAPYSKPYAKWKSNIGRGSKFWYLFGDLVTSINVTRYSGGWFGGIPNGLYDRGGKSWFGKGDKGVPKEIAMYGKVMEYGSKSHRGRLGKRQPARPLFTPTLQEFVYSRSKATQGDAWSISEDILKRIGKEWK